MAEYIDRNDLSKRMYHEAFERDSDLQRWDSGCWIRYHLFEIILDSIPVADVKPVVHGEWIEEDAYEYGENAWRCSACGEPYVLIEGTPKQNLYNFCPNCGADMR